MPTIQKTQRFRRPLQELEYEAKNIPAANPALIEHLWDMFGTRPTLQDLYGKIGPGRSIEAATLEALATQQGCEAVINYLQTMTENQR